MHRIRPFAVAGLLAILAIAAATTSVRAAGPAPKPRTAPARPGIACPITGCVTNDWNLVPSPNSGSGGNELYGVAVRTSTDAWAVGGQINVVGNASAYSTLIEHWDGQAWAIVPSPNIANIVQDYLRSVAIVSANDVWAVGPGYASTQQCPHRDVVEHWDGQTWSVVPAPALNEDCSDELFGVAAVATNDVWAVGKGYDPVNKVDEVVMEHWDGQTWTIIPGPTSLNGIPAYLNGVTAVSSTDVWAVGLYTPCLPSCLGKSLVEHWDGMQWSAVDSPNPSTRRNELSAVSARAANDIWAVGYIFDNVTVDQVPLIEHWDGTAWTAPLLQNFCGLTNCVLSGVAALASNNVWAVGSSVSTSRGNYTPLILHWDGANWRFSSAPLRSAESLFGVAGNATSAPVAVGKWFGNTTILRYGPPQFPIKGPARR
ncbi:MAG TPA: hypothetical protein VHR15_02340 [Ktedonobacterales bacterium]|jgi:hypothetical protein|nr:hypothetical protein [Ktedonobacterales bacterium]